MKRTPLKLSTEQQILYKKNCINYFKSCCSNFPSELEELAMLPGSLTPRWRPKGYLLQEPDTMVTEAHYLQSGIAILFSADKNSGGPNVSHIWEPGMVIVMYKEFDDQLTNKDHFIILAEDAELVTITNTCLKSIYKNYPIAHEITKTIISLKKSRMFLQMQILLMPVKTDRYAAFEKHFPNLRGKLSKEYLCGFLCVSPNTLLNSK